MQWKPVNWQTLDPRAVAKRYPTDEGGGYSPDWISTPPEPVVVRQDHPDGPTYQEALGYEFLIYNFKFAQMARLSDGTIYLRGLDYGDEDTAYIRNHDAVPLRMYSRDDGDSWYGLEKDNSVEPLRRQLVPLGGQELMLYGKTIHFSTDGGKTWSESVQVPQPEGDDECGIHGTALVERDDVTLIQYTQGGKGPSVLHRSHDRGRTWDERVPVPEFNGSEGSLVRARDGSWLAAMRTAFQDEGVPYLSDHWRGITVYRSTDEGKTWTAPPPLNKYGHVHMELLVLKNGDILMTYAARIGEIDGRTYHGIEAILSHDHGKTWDWQHRFILARCLTSQHMHSCMSLQRGDGRILTLFLQHDAAHFRNTGPPVIGHTRVVIWSP